MPIACHFHCSLLCKDAKIYLRLALLHIAVQPSGYIRHLANRAASFMSVLHGRGSPSMPHVTISYMSPYPHHQSAPQLYISDVSPWSFTSLALSWFVVGLINISQKSSCCGSTRAMLPGLCGPLKKYSTIFLPSPHECLVYGHVLPICHLDYVKYKIGLVVSALDLVLAAI